MDIRRYNELHDFISLQVNAGFDGREAIMGAAIDTLYDDVAYGSSCGGEDECVAVGHEIVAMLLKHRLQADWNGTLYKRIAITNIQMATAAGE